VLKPNCIAGAIPGGIEKGGMAKEAGLVDAQLRGKQRHRTVLPKS
jgi:hypothetical protein